MSTLRLAILFLGFLPLVTHAHQVNGTVRYPNGQPVRGSIRITCPPPANVLLEHPIDAQGGFGFFIQATGRCTLAVQGRQYPVYSSQNPVRYDLVLDSNALRRR